MIRTKRTKIVASRHVLAAAEPDLRAEFKEGALCGGEGEQVGEMNGRGTKGKEKRMEKKEERKES